MMRSNTPSLRRWRGRQARRAVTLLLLPWLAMLLGGCGGVGWRPDLGGAMRFAGRANRMVVVAYWSALNEDCVRMEHDVFANEDVIATLRSTVPVRLDATFNRSFARTYGLEAVPSFVILAPDGRVLRILRGYADEGRFRGAIEAARFAM